MFISVVVSVVVVIVIVISCGNETIGPVILPLLMTSFVLTIFHEPCVMYTSTKFEGVFRVISLKKYQVVSTERFFIYFGRLNGLCYFSLLLVCLLYEVIHEGFYTYGSSLI